MSRAWSFLVGVLSGVWASQTYELPRVEFIVELLREWEESNRKK